ncbi:MAG: hypothetical protein AB1Z67_01725 [Candidatus Limnocylindrales bacterium]
MSDWAPTGETFHDVVVVPYTDLLDRWRDGEIHRGGPMWPEWERQVGARHRRAGSPVDVRPAEPEGPIDEAGPMAWGGAIVDQFGHQVADFSARLLATAQARPDLPVAFASRPDLGYDSVGAAPSYFRALLAWFAIAPERVRVITATTRVAELFVAPQAEQLRGPGPAAGYLDALDALASTHLDPPGRHGGPLYVSRAGVPARFAGEEYLEGVLRAVGAQVMRPETLPLTAQLQAYRGSSDIVFAEGSAMHVLQLLGRVDADVLVLMRRLGTRLAEENLRPRVRALAYEELADRFIHGLLPTGRPAWEKSLSIVDADRFIAAFAARGLYLRAAWDDRAWSAVRDADILRWVEMQAADPGYLGPGSVEHLLSGLTEAGFGHLVDGASIRLDPLREFLAARTRVRRPDQPTMLFMHIPRTAGGAVRAALHEAVPEASRRDVYAATELDEAAFRALPEGERAGLWAVVGDFGFGLHEAIPGPARYGVMLRHPMSRILSLYRAAGRPRSLDAWVFEDRRIEADNAMVRAISGRPGVPFADCPDDLLDEAVANIEAHFDAVLIRGDMRRSAVVLGRAMGLTLPPFGVVNADPAGEDSFDPPGPVRKRIRELNRLDLALFKRYQQEF